MLLNKIIKLKLKRLVGRLIYLSHMRLDIIYVVSVVSQFMYHSRDRYMEVVGKTFQYLMSSLGKGFLFKK